MKEAYAIMAVAICAVAGLIVGLVNLLLLLVIRAELKRRDLASNEFHRSVGGRVSRIERYLVRQAKADEPMSSGVERGFTISGSKVQT